MVIGPEEEVAEIDEKRELLSNLKSWLKLRNKIIILEEK